MWLVVNDKTVSSAGHYHDNTQEHSEVDTISYIPYER